MHSPLVVRYSVSRAVTLGATADSPSYTKLTMAADGLKSITEPSPTLCCPKILSNWPSAAPRSPLSSSERAPFSNANLEISSSVDCIACSVSRIDASSANLLRSYSVLPASRASLAISRAFSFSCISRRLTIPSVYNCLDAS